MGEALLHSGAAQALAQQVQGIMPDAWRSQPIAIVLFVSLISLLAHCVITSRTARAMVLIPTIAIPFALGQVNATALIFISVVASGFCQTFTVSAKPVALFANGTEGAITPDDLWRLSIWLLPMMLGLLLVFSLIVWPLLGMPLANNLPICER
jgi:solute carrier family 13 (sodium-dependent dicarboxylate transporter), member 2/3/5